MLGLEMSVRDRGEENRGTHAMCLLFLIKIKILDENGLYFYTNQGKCNFFFQKNLLAASFYLLKIPISD